MALKTPPMVRRDPLAALPPLDGGDRAVWAGRVGAGEGWGEVSTGGGRWLPRSAEWEVSPPLGMGMESTGGGRGGRVVCRERA